MSDPGYSRDNGCHRNLYRNLWFWVKTDDEKTVVIFSKLPHFLQIWHWWCFMSSISVKKMKIVTSEISSGHPKKRKSRSTNWISRSTNRKRRSTFSKRRSTKWKRRSTFSKRRSTKRKSRSTISESRSKKAKSRSIFCLFRPIFENFWSILSSGD